MRPYAGAHIHDWGKDGFRPYSPRYGHFCSAIVAASRGLTTMPQSLYNSIP